MIILKIISSFNRSPFVEKAPFDGTTMKRVFCEKIFNLETFSLSKTTISQNVDGLEGRSEQKIDIKMLSSRSIAAVDVTFSINV